MMIMLSLGGCGKASCNSTNQMRTPQAPQHAVTWAQGSHLAAFVPSTARTVVFARALSTLTDVLDFGAQRLPLPGVGALHEAWTKTSPIDPFDADALKRAGFDPRANAVLFYDRGYWCIGAHLAAGDRLAKVLQNFEQAHKLEAPDIDFGSMDVSAFGGGGDHPVYVAHDDHTALLAVRAQSTDLDGLPQSWLPSSSLSRFVARDLHHKLLADLTKAAEVAGVIRPAAWLADKQAKGHAEVLWRRLLAQVGPVGFALNSVSLDKSVHLRVLTPGNPRAPAMITSLGRAQGDLPPLGGLIEPGVIGVARLSVDPKQLYALFESTLPASQRTELDKFWKDLNDKLSINARRDVLENLRGHAVVVAYGLDRKALEKADLPWFLQVLELKATREAVLLPIKEREPLVQVLDALTTVSKRKLTRQAVGHTLQYAWMENGELKWALIVSDEHVIYVDSAVAFEHAVDYERGAGPMGEKLDKLGITRLFDKKDAAGVYLDAASLADILEEAGHKDAVAWLAPFRSVVVTTGVDGDTGVTDFDLDIAPPAKHTPAPAGEGHDEDAATRGGPEAARSGQSH